MRMLYSPKTIFLIMALAFFSAPANGQFLKKLGKRAQKAAERTVERRVDQEASKKTDQTLDSILEPGKKGKQTPPDPDNPAPQNPGDEGVNTGNGDTGNNPTKPTGAKSIEVYSKFDYVPGDKPQFFDDFADDFIGDFPAKWNTNGGGEIVTLGDAQGKWYAIANKSITLPN